MFKEIRNKGCYCNLINGQWVRTTDSLSIYNPYDNSFLASISSMNSNDIDCIIEYSIESQKKWMNTPMHERAEILHRAADLLEENCNYIANILMNEICKDINSCISEVTRTCDFIHHTADAGKHLEGTIIDADNFPGFKRNKMSFIKRVPIGVVVAISPFNYPINLSASKIAPALIAGNSVILKPSLQGSISALHLARIFQVAGIPDGVLNTITGRSKSIGDYLITRKGINFINFTGSTKTGRHIANITGMTPMLLELGGKDAAIVLEDADLDECAKEIVSGAFSYSGQRCTAIKRVLVIDSVANDLVSKLSQNISELKVGSPKDGCEITPLIDEDSADYVEHLIQDAIKKGAHVIKGNKRTNNLIYPTLLDMVTEDMSVAWEEPFGPVLPVIRVKNIDEAISIANKSSYGLQSSVFTNNINSAFYIADKLEVGTVQINSKSERGPDHFPFSGVKDSGMGTQGIKHSIEAMTRIKSTVITTLP